mmetsp:Transcript_13404/g.20073  ORF Transcript_13404/g.20073 Transcript_13404/m.20073 type:complete len:150 (-) Transcript_13404:273-722(-)
MYRFMATMRNITANPTVELTPISNSKTITPPMSAAMLIGNQPINLKFSMVRIISFPANDASVADPPFPKSRLFFVLLSITRIEANVANRVPIVSVSMCAAITPKIPSKKTMMPKTNRSRMSREVSRDSERAAAKTALRINGLPTVFKSP